MRIARPAGLALAALLLLLPGSAIGAVTIGSNLTAGGTPTNFGLCGGGTACTYAQVAPLPAANTAQGGLTSPMDGVVTRWRIKSGSAGGAVTLRVLRPTGSGAFTAIATSAAGTTASGTAQFTTSLPIRAGDYIGVNNASDALIFAPTPGASVYYWQPPLLDSSNRAATGTFGPRELLVQADVEPDVDCDGLGDETQDPNTSDGPCAPRPGGGGGGGGGGTGGADRTAPQITALSSRRVKRGTTFRYTLSEAARVVFTIETRQTGRNVAGTCRKQTRANRTKRRCTFYVFAGSFAQQATAGQNSKRFSGRIGRKALKPGKQRATLVATDAAGNVSAPQRIGFTTVRG